MRWLFEWPQTGLQYYPCCPTLGSVHCPFSLYLSWSQCAERATVWYWASITGHQTCVCLVVENLRPSSVQIVRASNTLLKMPSIILRDCNVTSFKICRLRIPAGMAYAAVCKEFSRVEAGRKCSQRKSRQCLCFLLSWLHTARQQQVCSTTAARRSPGKSI